MNFDLLEDEAWSLQLKLHRIIETECIGLKARISPSVRKARIKHAHVRAYSRFLRRVNKRGA